MRGYADSSDFVISGSAGAVTPARYLFNVAARRFYRVKAEVDYIDTTSAGVDGNLADQIDRYTRTDTYDYVLELNSQDEIIGGEWIGESKKHHPDFLWLPVSQRGTTFAGGAIRRSDVMTLYEKSIQPINQDAVDNLEVLRHSGTIANGEVRQYGPYHVKDGETLLAVMTGTNDADLYVRIGAPPATASYTCRPYKQGSDEECHVLSTGTPMYASIMGYATLSDFTLQIEYIEHNAATDPASQ